jgi:hypothetical protein
MIDGNHEHERAPAEWDGRTEDNGDRVGREKNWLYGVGIISGDG